MHELGPNAAYLEARLSREGWRTMQLRLHIDDIHQNIQEGDQTLFFRIYLAQTAPSQHYLEHLKDVKRVEENISQDENYIRQALAEQYDHAKTIQRLIEHYQLLLNDPDLDEQVLRDRKKIILCMEMQVFLCQNELFLSLNSPHPTATDYEKYKKRSQMTTKLEVLFEKATKLLEKVDISIAPLSKDNWKFEGLFQEGKIQLASLCKQLQEAKIDNAEILRSIDVLRKSKYFSCYEMQHQTHRQDKLYRQLYQLPYDEEVLLEENKRRREAIQIAELNHQKNMSVLEEELRFEKLARERLECLNEELVAKVMKERMLMEELEYEEYRRMF